VLRPPSPLGGGGAAGSRAGVRAKERITFLDEG
jgi:hypothetical protein